MSNYYGWVDTETGGFDENFNPIIQLALVITTSAFTEVLRYSSLVNPGLCPIVDTKDSASVGYMHLTPSALAVNKIDPAQLNHAPSEKKVALQLQMMLDDYRNQITFAGYNCPFDLKFLASWEKRADLKFGYKTPAFDVMPLARQKLNLPKYKLTNVAEHFGLDTTGAHDALKDLELTIEAARRLAQ